MKMVMLIEETGQKDYDMDKEHFTTQITNSMMGNRKKGLSDRCIKVVKQTFVVFDQIFKFYFNIEKFIWFIKHSLNSYNHNNCIDT